MTAVRIKNASANWRHMSLAASELVARELAASELAARELAASELAARELAASELVASHIQKTQGCGTVLSCHSWI